MEGQRTRSSHPVVGTKLVVSSKALLNTCAIAKTTQEVTCCHPRWLLLGLKALPSTQLLPTLGRHHEAGRLGTLACKSLDLSLPPLSSR